MRLHRMSSPRRERTARADSLLCDKQPEKLDGGSWPDLSLSRQNSAPTRALGPQGDGRQRRLCGTQPVVRSKRLLRCACGDIGKEGNQLPHCSRQLELVKRAAQFVFAPTKKEEKWGARR
jgi:hypothetical protein